MARGRIVLSEFELIKPRLIEPDWPAPAGVRAVSTTRAGGVSRPPYASLNLGEHVGDEPGAVAQNREILGHALHLTGEPRWLNQVHGTRIVNAGDVVAPVEADGGVAAVPGVVCVVMTADCLPVILCDRAGGHVAAVHGGWRGLAAGVIEAAVAEFTRRGVRPCDMLCWLGPAIGPKAYEVGPDVRDALGPEETALAASPAKADRWFLDLYALARSRLRRTGVESVYGGGFCTYADRDRFYSHRREGRCGRQATLIWRIC
jgi:YfiH family protein